MRIRHLLLSLCLLPLLACCTDVEVMPDTPEGNLEALWTIIDQRYCFLSYKQQTLGVDWDEVHVRYRQRINPQMTRGQLFEVMSEMLGELQDGHVNLYSAANLGRNWSWYEDHPRNLDQELREAYLGTDYRIASSLRYRILPDNVAYVVCTSFASPIGEGNLDEVMYYLRTCNGMILDIRGNTGGDLTTAQTLASRFTNERRMVGYISHKTGPGHDAFSTPQPQYLNPSHGIRWQRRTVVLTNRQCYSAANTFVRDMQGLPRVTILGDQTGGGSGMPMSSELPCGWSVRYSACPMYDRQMRHIEFGIQPDIAVSLLPQDAQQGYDTLIETARQLLARPIPAQP